jgi:hypothetical protein
MKYVPNVLFIVIGCLMIWQILSAPLGRSLQIGDPGPWFLPAVLASLLIFLGGVEFIRTFRKSKQLPDSGSSQLKEVFDEGLVESGVETIPAPNWRSRIVFVLSVIGYVAVYTYWGFSVSTFLFVSISILSLSNLSPKSILAAILTALITTLFVGWLLAGVVGVPLPGVWIVI